MDYKSTRQRREAPAVHSTEAMVKGLPDDGGLFVPGDFPAWSAEALKRLASLPRERAYAEILDAFVDDLGKDELARILRGMLPDLALRPRWTQPEVVGDAKLTTPRAYYSAHGLEQLNPYLKDRYRMTWSDGVTANVEDYVLGLIPEVIGALRRRGATADGDEGFEFVCAGSPGQVTAAAVAFARACEAGALDARDSFRGIYAAHLYAGGRNGIPSEEDPFDEDEDDEDEDDDEESAESSDLPEVPESVEDYLERPEDLLYNKDHKVYGVATPDGEKEDIDLAAMIVRHLEQDRHPGVRLLPEADPKEALDLHARETAGRVKRPPLPASLAERYASGQMRLIPVGAFDDQIQLAVWKLRQFDLEASEEPVEGPQRVWLDERHPLALLLPTARLLAMYGELLADDRLTPQDPLTLVVPTSDLTLFVAVTYAAQMGLPLKQIFAGTGQNREMAEGLRNGIIRSKRYDKVQTDDEGDLVLADARPRGARKRVKVDAKGREREDGNGSRGGGGQPGGQEGGGKKRKKRKRGRRNKKRGGGKQEATPRESGGRGGSSPKKDGGRSRRNKGSKRGGRGRGRKRKPGRRQLPTGAMTPNFEPVIPTNLERLLYELTGRDGETIRTWWEQLLEEGEFRIPQPLLDQMKSLFLAGYADKKEIGDAIRSAYDLYDVAWEPHTAAAYAAFRRQNAGQEPDGPLIYLETQSPYMASRTMVRTFFGQKVLRRLSRFGVLARLMDELQRPIPAIVTCGYLPETPALPLTELEALLRPVGPLPSDEVPDALADETAEDETSEDETSEDETAEDAEEDDAEEEETAEKEVDAEEQAPEDTPSQDLTEEATDAAPTGEAIPDTEPENHGSPDAEVVNEEGPDAQVQDDVTPDTEEDAPAPAETDETAEDLHGAE